MRLAYLCNVYPAVSHSFVRREIEGVEAAGHAVHRFSMRPPQADLKDDADVREAKITESVLARGVFQLGVAAAVLLLTRPANSLRAITAAHRLSGPGFKRRLRHVAYWLEAAWLVRRMDQLGIEHLHAHFGTNPAAVAAIAQAWGGPQFSFTVHGPDEFDAPIDLGLPEKIQRAAFVAAITHYCRSQLMRWSNSADWDKIRIVRCGLDRSYLEAETAPIPDESTNFVTVARLSAQKGLPILFEACDRLRRAGTNFSLTVIGDGELREQLERDIRDRNLGGTIELAGSRSADEIQGFLRRARAFVLPSFAEGLPVVLMEALSLSRPVITTAIAGIPELVDDGCGWLIPAGSEGALVEAMQAALDSPLGELNAKGAVGRDRARLMHDAERNARTIANYFGNRASLASANPPPGTDHSFG